MSTTQEKILAAARQCLAARGVGQTSVLDIVAAAGISRTTFYRQFRDMDDILVTLAARLLTDRLHELARLLTQPALPATERWRDFIAAVVRIRETEAGNPLNADAEFHYVVRLFYGTYRDKLQQMVNSLEPLINAGKTAGELRTDVDSARIGEWLLRQSWALASLPMESHWPQDQLLEYITTFLLPALLRPNATDNTARLSKEIDRLERITARLETRG